MQSNVCPAVHFVSLFRLDGDTGRAAHDAIRAAELGEDAVRLRHQRHAVARRRENAEGRRRIGLDRGRDARGDR